MPGRPPKFIGVKNYARLLSDPEIWGYFQTTAYFVLLAVTAQFLIGFGLALLLNREFRNKGLITTLLLLPMMLSPVVVGLFWRFILASDRSGLLNFFLSPFLSAPIGWTTDPKIAMIAVVIVDTWMWSPFHDVDRFSPGYLLSRSIFTKLRTLIVPQVGSSLGG